MNEGEWIARLPWYNPWLWTFVWGAATAGLVKLLDSFGGYKERTHTSRRQDFDAVTKAYADLITRHELEIKRLVLSEEECQKQLRGHNRRITNLEEKHAESRG